MRRAFSSIRLRAAAAGALLAALGFVLAACSREARLCPQEGSCLTYYVPELKRPLYEQPAEPKIDCEKEPGRCRRYYALSFFFDGVPVPGEERSFQGMSPKDIKAAKIKELRDRVETKFYNHDPYAEKDCHDCHDESHKGQYVVPLEELCYECHDDFADEFKYLHDPAESGECTECHSPHFSKYKKLLLRQGWELCLECHDEDELPEDEHEDLERGEDDCIDCHDPHGGDSRSFT